MRERVAVIRRTLQNTKPAIASMGKDVNATRLQHDNWTQVQPDPYMMQLTSESPRTPYRMYPIWIVQSWKLGGGSWPNATCEQRRQTKNGTTQIRRKLMRMRPFIAHRQDVAISLRSDKANRKSEIEMFSITRPLIVISRGRIGGPGEICSVVMHLEIAHVAVDEADDVSGIVEFRIFF
jgi:hypothetical protein